MTEAEALLGQNGLCAHACTQVLEGQFFIPGPVLKFIGVCIWNDYDWTELTIAKSSVENSFPIEIDNLRIPAQTPVNSSTCTPS